MAADRLTMSEVVSMLTNELTVLNSPKKPAFSNARSTINSSNQPEKFSVNDVTVYNIRVSAIDTLFQGQNMKASASVRISPVAGACQVFIRQRSNKARMVDVYNGTVSATDTLFQGQNMTASVVRMKNVPTKDIVWVANRDLPFTGSSMILTINGDGYLMIVNDRTTYRVSDDPSSSQNVSATLFNSGNLVLRNGNLDILWQSFDSPLNMFLPGMKLGYNNKTGKVWSLTSWLDEEDPNKGDFELKMDPKNSNAVLLMRGSQTLWSSGPWNGHIFVLMPEMRLNYIFNYSLYTDENETYFWYSLYNPETITRFILDIDGRLKESSWLGSSQEWALFWAQPRQFCEALNSCGLFSSCSEDTRSCSCLRGFYPSGKQQGQDGGCMRRVALTCGNGDNRDMFFRMNDVRYPVSSTQQINSSYNFPSGPQVSNSDPKACREACLSNCTCSAYAYNTSGNCLRWYGDILGLEQLSAKDPNGRTIFIKLAASEFDNGRGTCKKPFN
ncbi:G-type lectin S-receptor-like serine/threonine-protein kinase At2g19130 [Gossypium hirsutum]|uniref:G-type lectin S-receptor-like serine/threonine-protein kinase At2g19130 n=1 Tax=Gossypium hirsutum TaxID=3635 RepID=A0ABM3BJ30_GOSHI|nr:G-type lectin S-receptor-like serine/threonine-protein kinase At2g19130 [Gossypium hirsutum]